MEFDIIIPVVAKDVQKLEYTIPALYENIEFNNIYVIGNSSVEEELKKRNLLGQRTRYYDENRLILFDDVKQAISDITTNEKAVKRTGWYYQQFLKYQWANICKNKYYVVWDADTILLTCFSLFENGKPVFDLKNEYNKSYFDTIENLGLGLKKVEKKSFISEHMIFNVDIVKQLLNDIENEKKDIYWKAILRTINTEVLENNGFSEFETYGCYCMLRHDGEYQLREYDSFRDGGRYFDITQLFRSVDWIKKDYTSISFEKWAIPKPLYIKIFSMGIVHALFHFKRLYQLSIFCEKVSTKIKNKCKRKKYAEV